MILAALPFAGGGLLALVLGIYFYPANPNAIVAIIIGSVFTLASLSFVIAVRLGAAASAKMAAAQLQHPGEPWMWRDDWARGAIKDWNKGRAITIWVLTVIWNAIAFPVAFVPSSSITRSKLIVIFPLIGIFLLLSAIYQTLRMMKFGTSTCHLEQVPVVPGRTVRGHIELNNGDVPKDGYRLRLASLRVTRARKSGRSSERGNRTDTEKVLWAQEIVVEESAAMRGPEGTRVPFEFTTPQDAHVTDEGDSFDRYIWRISASAGFPGVDYTAQFEVPVFKSRD